MKKGVKFFLSFFVSFFMMTSLTAQCHLQELPIGEIEASDEKLCIGENEIPLVKINDSLYLSEDHLNSLGMALKEEEESFYIERVEDEKVATEQVETAEIGEEVKSVAKPVYCQHARAYMVRTKEHFYMPLWVLKGQWQLACVGEQQIKGNYYFASYLAGVVVTETGIKNDAVYGLHLICRRGFWEGENFRWTQEELMLAPGEEHRWQGDEKGIFAGMQIEVANGLELPLENQTDFECQRDFLKAYSRAERLAVLDKMFPPYVIQASMNYNIGPLKEKQQVSLIRSEKHMYYWVKDESGHKIQVPFGSVKVLGEKGVPVPAVTGEEIQEFANLKGIESETDFLIWTDLYRQRTYVLQKKEGQWQHLHTFICSTGKNINPTPAGFYKVQYAIPYFGLGKGYRCKYALVFFRDYMYHSILFDKTGQYIKSGQYELGSKASHGCIRLSEKDSQWLYQSIPVHTTVWIR